MENICARQALKDIWVDTGWTVRVLGTAAVDSSRSHIASTHRKMHTGSCRLRSLQW